MTFSLHRATSHYEPTIIILFLAGLEKVDRSRSEDVPVIEVLFVSEGADTDNPGYEKPF